MISKFRRPIIKNGDGARLVIGLMSGTSVDGIDAALVRIRGSGEHTEFALQKFLNVPYPPSLRRMIIANSDAAGARIDAVTTLDFLLGELFADAAIRVARQAGVPTTSVRLIGSHGQTIHHLPGRRALFGKRIRSTLQIGNISIIAARTGVPTVGNFRAADIAAGGTGAPLVPYFDYIALRSPAVSRAALNIGGIANITVVPKNCSLSRVSAFDTGPGNMIIDALMQRWYGRDCDDGGDIASQGKIVPQLLRWLLGHPFLKQRPPKSTGRETFGEQFVRQLLGQSQRFRRKDVITTVTEFTALSVYDQYARYVRPGCRIDELVVSGGGTHNMYLMDALTRYFAEADVLTSSSFGIDPDAKEAICFALLANETVSGNPSNVPRATGARRPAILGTIAFP